MPKISKIKNSQIYLLVILIQSILSSNDIINFNSGFENQIYHKNGNCTITIENYYSVITPMYWLDYEGIRCLILNMINLEYLEPKSIDGIEFKQYRNNLQIKTKKDKISKFVVYNIICRLLYNTKYIKNNIYSITISERYEPNLWSFGGLNLQAISNFNLTKKITFDKKDILSEIYINEKKISFEGKYDIIFSDNYSSICLPEELFNKFNQTFLYKYSKYKKEYEQNDIFPEIKFKIGNKIILLNANNFIYEHMYDIKKNNLVIFIFNKPCENLIFGWRFLYLFKLIEFNLEKGETSFYLTEEENNNKKNILFEDKKTKIILYNSTSTIYIEFIMIISFIFFSIILIFSKKYKNKINFKEYLNSEYYEI